jgi:hypothetical protein
MGAATRTITLTIGGNDIGFANVLAQCIYARGPISFFSQGNPGCSNDDSVTTAVNSRMLSLSGTPRLSAPDGRTIHALGALIDELHRRAPNARIFVADYPRLLGTQETSQNNARACKVGVAHIHTSGGTVDDNLLLAENDVSWLIQTGAKLDNLISDQVAAARRRGVPITFVELRSKVAGHGLCDTLAPWIRSVTADVYDNGRTKVIDPGSFHPNQTGQGAFEGAFRDNGIG